MKGTIASLAPAHEWAGNSTVGCEVFSVADDESPEGDPASAVLLWAEV